MNRTNRKWTKEEEQRLLQQVKLFPQNLTRCFFIVAEVTNRTPTAVAAHWYNIVSKDPDVLCFFTASTKHISKNRKNAKGVEIKRNIWQRLLSIIKKI